MKTKDLENVKWDEGRVPQALEYYVGVETATIQAVQHPDNLWTILDRMHTMVLDDGELSDEQKQFLHHFLEKWMGEIVPFCFELRSE